MVASVAVILAACCNCRTNKSKSSLPLTDTNWQLVEWEGRPFAATGEQYTLKLTKDGRLSGMGNCNRLMGAFETPRTGIIKFSAMASTRMMCPDQQTESKFTQMLPEVDGYGLDGDMLMLFKGGERIMTFAVKAE